MKYIVKSIINSLVCVLFVVFLMKGHYTHKPITPSFIGSMVEPFHTEGVYILAKRYTAEESKKYLYRNLHKDGLYPVQMTIQNNTQHSYFLSKGGVGLSNKSSNEVANREYLRSLPRSIAFKAAAFFFWPFLIPGTIDTLFTAKAHFSFKKDLYAKSIKEEGEQILPYSTVHRILFVPQREFQDGFILHLKHLSSRQSTAFSVEISS